MKPSNLSRNLAKEIKPFKRDLSCDFYRVRSSRPFPDLIDEIITDFPNTEDRNLPGDGDTSLYRICMWTRKGVNGRGVMARFRSGNPALIGSLLEDVFRDIDMT
ncbi:MAG: hypothetical protein EOP04_07450, partial [Proteobacteria bacterium]